MQDRPATDDALAEVLAALHASRKYRSLDEGALRRVAEGALAIERGKVKAAVARARRKLHQAHGAYVGEAPRWDRMLRKLREAPDEAARHALLRAALARHSSSREREPHLEQLWSELGARLPAPRRVLDLACGLNPLARPWSPWPAATEHVSADVDAAMLAFVGETLALEGIAHREILTDLAATTPADEADLALLLKAYHCLERQREGAGMRVLRETRAPVVVVSFPTLSLGGRDVGMRTSYAEDFEPKARAEGFALELFEIPGEMLYVVRR